MLAILVAFGAALLIWFHGDGTPAQDESACLVPSAVVVSADTTRSDFSLEVFQPKVGLSEDYH